MWVHVPVFKIFTPVVAFATGRRPRTFIEVNVIELNSVVIATIHDNNGNRQGQYINNSEPNLVGAWRLDEGRTINTPCLTGSDAILCDVMGETTPLAAVTAVNNVLLAGFSPPPTAGSWTTGIVPLGLTWTSTLVNGKAFVTYR